MELLKKKLGGMWPLLSIFGIWLLVVLTNYRTNTWLIGWDSLAPEFNFLLNIQRSITGTWQEYQGLGLSGGMAHNADLIRQIFLLIASHFLPASFLRYFWHFLMLLIGPIGIYYLNKKHFFKKNNSDLIPLAGAIFYLFNLATVQYFYVPYEAFSSFYGFLPWILLAFLNHLKWPTNKSLLKVFFVFIIAAPAFYVQTLFITLIISLSFFSFTHLFQNKKQISKAILLNVKTYLTILVASIFWLIPVVYFTISSVSNTVESQQNRISTPEVSLQNKGSGSLHNISRLKGFWFDYIYVDEQSNTPNFLFKEWQDYVNHPLIEKTSIIIFAISLIGLITTVFNKKNNNKFILPALMLFVFSLIMLSGGSGYLGKFYELLAKNIPLFGQIFRTSFTKWSIVTALCMNIGLVLFLTEIKTVPIIKKILAALTIIVSILAVAPILKGGMISKNMTQQLPAEYLALFDYLKQQKAEKRIIHLPSPDIWGWQDNDWGYRGSGFLWYGIQQPIFDRNFDTWGPTNEQAYKEIEHALGNSDQKKISQLFQKYNFSYVLIDESIVSADNDNLQKTVDDMQNLLIELGGKIEWQQNSLILIDLNKINPYHDFLSAPKTFVSVDSDLSRSSIDPIYDKYHDYLINNDSSEAKNSTIFPFTNLGQTQILTGENPTIAYEPIKLASTNKLIIPDINELSDFFSGPVEISYLDNVVSFDFLEPGVIEIGNDQFQLPKPKNFQFATLSTIQDLVIKINSSYYDISLGETKKLWINKIEIKKELKIIYSDKNKTSKVGNKYIIEPENSKEFSVPDSSWEPLLEEHQFPIEDIELNNNKIQLTLNTPQIDLTDNLIDVRTIACDAFERGTTNYSFQEKSYAYQADEFGSLCFGINMKEASTMHDYWLNISGNNESGRALRFFVENLKNDRIVIEDITPNGNYRSTYLLHADQDLEPSNLAINLNTRSLGGEKAINKIQELHLYELPISLKWLEQIRIIDQPETIKNNVLVEEIKKIGTGIYFAKAEALNSKQSIISLSQTYSPAWLAYAQPVTNGFWDLSTWKRLHHHHFNSWANAWEIQEGKYKIIIFYWPQLLVFGSYIISIITALYLTVKTLKSPYKKTIDKVMSGK